MREAIAGFLASSLIFFFGQSTASAQSTVTIRVDAAANRRPINPDIYGVAHATTAQLNDLDAPLHRNGGNNTTRYNWQLNADNRGNDWYYQSIPDNSATAGERGDSFIANSACRRCRSHVDGTSDRVGGQGRSRPHEAREFFNRQVRPADRQRLAVVSGCRKRNPDERPVRHRQRSERRQRSVDRRVPARLDRAPREPVGNERKRRPALLHPR